MKNRFYGRVWMVGAVGLVLVLGCSNHSAQQESIRTTQAAGGPAVAANDGAADVTNLLANPSPPILYTAAPPASLPPKVLAEDPTPGALPAPAIERRAEQTAPQDLSPAAQDVIKMAQAGVGEGVLLTFVENSKTGFGLNSEAIVYLNDLGVSARVVTAMIQRDAQLGVAAEAPPAAAPEPAVAPTQMESNAREVVEQPAGPPEQTPPPTEEPAPQPVYASPPPLDAQASYFYDSLSPYGSWMYVAGYGWCWQPTAVVTCGGWRPYCDAGRWYWSDNGWYWYSDYSWGWAPFHYGRWFCHGRAGWLWCPGTVWGPSWVSWRYAAGYCGWAPLPPAAGWAVGFGFRFNGVSVGIGCEFGLSYAHYSWIPTRRFCDYNLRRYCEPYERARPIYQNSTVINNYAINRTTIINHGVGRDTVGRSVGTELRTVSIRERGVDRSSVVRPERLQTEGSRLIVQRPSLPAKPPTVSSATFNQGAAATSSGGGKGPNGSGLQTLGNSRSSTALGSGSPIGATSGAKPLSLSTGNSGKAPLSPGSVPSVSAGPSVSSKPVTVYGSDKPSAPTAVAPGASLNKANNTPSYPRSGTVASVPSVGAGHTTATKPVTIYGSDKPSAPAAGTPGIYMNKGNTPPFQPRSGTFPPVSSGDKGVTGSASTPRVESSLPRVSTYSAPSALPATRYQPQTTLPAPTVRSDPVRPAPQYYQPSTVPAPSASPRSYSPAPAPSTPSYSPAPSHSAPSYSPPPAYSPPAHSENHSTGTGRTK